MTKAALTDILFAFLKRLEAVEQRLFTPINFRDLDRNAQELVEIGKKLKLMASLDRKRLFSLYNSMAGVHQAC